MIFMLYGSGVGPARFVSPVARTSRVPRHANRASGFFCISTIAPAPLILLVGHNTREIIITSLWGYDDFSYVRYTLILYHILSDFSSILT